MENKFTKQNFETEVLQSELPVLVDFYADWCGPCKMMAPVVDKLAEELAGKIKVGKLNVDEEAELAMKYRVVSIPTFLVFKDGEIKATCVGAMSANQLLEKVEAAIR
ncbi:MAG: thioredoxin [Lachnospiraceae bacterium]